MSEMPKVVPVECPSKGPATIVHKIPLLEVIALGVAAKASIVSTPSYDTPARFCVHLKISSGIVDIDPIVAEFTAAYGACAEKLDRTMLVHFPATSYQMAIAMMFTWVPNLIHAVLDKVQDPQT